MDDFEQELKRDFLTEAADLLISAESSFMKLESEPTNMSLVDAIFRFAHNLKGTSRAVGFGQIAELTHTAENLLLKIKQGEVSVSAPVVDIMLRFNDKVVEMVHGLQENLEAAFDIASLVQALEAALKGEIAIPAPAIMTPEIVQVSEAPGADDFPEEEVIADVAAVELAPAPKPIERAPVKATETKVETKIESKSETKTEAKKDDETIRVSLNRLEKLSDLVGELVILQSVVERALIEQPSELKTRRSLAKLCKDIQEMSMALRMVPVAGAFQKLQRIVRDTSKALDKKVELKLLGEETEIDRTVLEHLGDPLVHLIRNAVDHGIEQPHDRIINGKPEVGTVEVMALHEGSYLVIQITDDGKGMDPAALVKKAREKGILRADQTLSDQDAFNLIFHAGFSTKEQVSEVSGRGVGMDVVKTNIEALGGEIKLASKLGVGSSIRLMLPLTLAIIEGMLVSSCEQRLIIPRNQIHEINRLDASLVQLVGGKVPLYRLRDEVLPLFYLADELGKSKQNETIVLIVRSSSSTFAVAIEDVVRQQQVVVKPSTVETQGRVGIMGTTILGDGMPSLILDLIELYSKRSAKAKRAA
jgi:two-component system chemotaxis sensor kinase CheA